MRRRCHWTLTLAVLVTAPSLVAWTAALAQDAPVRGGTAVVAIIADPGHLNPAITTSGATHAAAELLYNGLLGRDERGDPVPELAESWTIEQAGALYRFRLRDGVTWHDGARFTAGDVKFTFEEVLLKFHARTRASMAAVLAGMRDNPRRGFDPVIVKGFINLVGIYPVGTLVVLDTFELAIVHSVNPNPQAISRPVVRIVSDDRGNILYPGELADLTEQSSPGVFRRTIIKTENPERYGITVGDYFV